MADDPILEPPAHTHNLLTVACAMLDSYGYKYHALDAITVQLALGHPRGLYQVYVTANDEIDFVRVICHYGSHVPVDRRVAVAEALARINWKMGIGSFEMDFSDGEVRFRVGIDVEDGLLSEKMVDNMLGFSMHNMEKYHDALMRIAFGDAEPEPAVLELP